MLAFVVRWNFDDADTMPTVALLFATVGLMVGAVTGVVGAVVAGLLSRTDVEVRAARLVAGVVSGALVATTVWWLFGRSDDDVIQLLETPAERVQLVVVPALLAVAIGAW